MNNFYGRPAAGGLLNVATAKERLNFFHSEYKRGFRRRLVLQMLSLQLRDVLNHSESPLNSQKSNALCRCKSHKISKQPKSWVVVSIDLCIISSYQFVPKFPRNKKSCTQPALAEVGAWTLIYRHHVTSTRNLADYTGAVLTSATLATQPNVYPVRDTVGKSHQ